MANILDLAVPIVEKNDNGEFVATSYFEDYLFEIIESLGGEGAESIASESLLSIIAPLKANLAKLNSDEEDREGMLAGVLGELAFLRQTVNNLRDEAVEDYDLEVAKGNISGTIGKLITGSNPSTDLIFEDVWDGGDLQTLPYDTQTGNFVIGQIVTAGGGAFGTIVLDADAGAAGTLTLAQVSGTFANNDTITDPVSGAALVNGSQSRISDLVYPTAAEALEVLSSSANDTSAGTGATGITYTSLDDSYIEQTAVTVSLNGLIAVALTGTHFRTVSFSIDGAGSIGTNDGYIILRSVATGAIRGLIRPSFSNTLDSHYTVPENKDAYVDRFLLSTDKNNDTVVIPKYKLFGETFWRTLSEDYMYQNMVFNGFKSKPKLPAKTDFKFIAKSINTISSISAGLEIKVVDG